MADVVTVGEMCTTCQTIQNRTCLELRGERLERMGEGDWGKK
jgi:hypothetical protein